MGLRLGDRDVATPVLAAPMAGGPSTVALVAAAARAGSFGVLAGGYKTAADLARQIDEARAADVAFGVNLFVPNPVPITARAYAAYADALRPLADRFGVDLPPAPVEDDDGWPAKLDLLRRAPVPVVSFTFAVPPYGDIAELRRRGTTVVQNVTSPAEAVLAVDAGVDVLAVQASAAGGHSATFTPHVPVGGASITTVVAAIRRVTTLPIVAGGGLSTAAEVAAVVRAGASAAMVGTALLRTPESGTSAVQRAALADRAGPDTVLTRAFTGRPARAIQNRFVDDVDARAPLGYPAIHHLTSALRRAAAAAGDPSAVHLWAGTGYRASTDDAAADVLTALAAGL